MGRKIRIAFAFIAFTFMLFLLSCSQSSTDDYLGTWVSSDDDGYIELTIEKDGMGTRSAKGGNLADDAEFKQPIEWEVKGEKLMVKMNNYIGNDMSDTFILSEDKTVLTSSSYDSEYIKQTQ